MCSLVDGALEPNVDEDVQEDQVHPGGKTICQKCRISPPILTLRKKDVYCESCFLTGCHHKFRSTLGKNKAIHFNDRVVVAFSGSQGSLAVLKLIRSSLEDKNNPKKLPYTPFVLIIDESGLCLDHEYSIKDVINLAKIFSFDVHVTHLSTALRQDTCLKSADGYNDEPSTATTGLKELLVKTPETSSKLSLLKELRRQIMLRAAVELKCSKIFTGECATSLAITLLSGVAMGRGAQISNDAGFCDKRHDEVQILRPLREFSVKEVALFNEYCFKHPGETAIAHVTALTGEDLRSSSIGRLTESFVLSLQEGFPSTVPTIFRTGDKLLQDAQDQSSVKCVLCSGNMDRDADLHKGCSAIEATDFSKMVSEKGPKGLGNDDLTLEMFSRLSVTTTTAVDCKSSSTETSSCSAEGLCSEGSQGGCKSEASTIIDKTKILCYSCANVLANVEPLPAFLTRTAHQELMRQKIQDFLL